MELELEKLIKINNLHPYYEGKITVQRVNNKYFAEVAIIHAESQKIFQYVDTLYGFEDQKEALNIGVQKLSSYLLKK